MLGAIRLSSVSCESRGRLVLPPRVGERARVVEESGGAIKWDTSDPSAGLLTCTRCTPQGATASRDVSQYRCFLTVRQESVFPQNPKTSHRFLGALRPTRDAAPELVPGVTERRSTARSKF